MIDQIKDSEKIMKDYVKSRLKDLKAKVEVCDPEAIGTANILGTFADKLTDEENIEVAVALNDFVTKCSCVKR